LLLEGQRRMLESSLNQGSEGKDKLDIIDPERDA
jgi:hypothetical protein